MAKKKVERWQAKLGTSLNPIQVLEIQDAVRDKKDRVSLEGVWFVLTYMEDGETVRYTPEIGYAPMGYLNIEKLLRSI